MLRLAAYIFVTVICLSAVQVHATDHTFKVDEKNIKAVIKDDHFDVTIPISHTGEVMQTVLEVELLDSDDRKLATTQTEQSFKSGTTSSVVRLILPINHKKPKDEEQFLYSRLKYKLATLGTNQPLLTGYIALASATSDLYELNIAYAKNALLGQDFQIRVHAMNPVTLINVAGVALHVQYELDDKNIKPKMSTATTNSKGDAVFHFTVPKGTDSDSVAVTVDAAKEGSKRHSDLEVKIDHQLKVVVSTDKPLYQPGQQLHVRTLAFDNNRQAIADREFDFILVDPDDETVLQGKAESNKFGIASVDWELPSNLRLGEYSVRVKMTDDESSDERPWGASVKVSRYELPTFAVTAKTDRSYYLPGQDSEFRIGANYLFGKPVTRGTVRIVRETEREWDYKKQKWTAQEDDEHTGTLDATGQFKVQVDLNALQKDFKGNSYRKFQDIKYAAYVTDTTTGRAEQKRFMVRLSHDPIHVYVNYAPPIDHKLTMQISTFLPDGTPAPSRLKIFEAIDDKNSDEPDAVIPGAMLASVETNKFGLAKVSNLKISPEDEKSYRLLIRVADRNGATAQHVESIWNINGTIAITTTRTILKPDEPIDVNITSSLGSGTVMLDVLQGGGVLHSQTVSLRHGKGFAVIPFLPKFQGVLTLVVYSLEKAKSRYDFPVAYRSVIYPRDQQLRVKMTPLLTGYRPGDEFSALLKVRSPDGTTQPSAVGVVVVDKAVTERARTDDEFGGRGRGFWDWNWWEEESSYGGVSLQDLQRIDTSAPISDDMQLVAEMILNQAGSYYSLELEGYDYESTTESKYRTLIHDSLGPIAKILYEREEPNWHFPLDKVELAKAAKSKGFHLEEIIDPWGTPFRITFEDGDQNITIKTESAGPDKTFDTADDISGETYSWNYFTPTGRVIEKAVAEAFIRDNSNVHDTDTLRQAVLRGGLDLNSLHTHKGNSYRFVLNYYGEYLYLNVYTMTPEQIKENQTGNWVWTSTVPYFKAQRERIDKVIVASGVFPRTTEELDSVLAQSNMSVSKMLDPWGRPFVVEFPRITLYRNRTVVESRTGKESSTTPVSQLFDQVKIKSFGPDGKPDTMDDFTVATYSHYLRSKAVLTSNQSQ